MEKQDFYAKVNHTQEKSKESQIIAKLIEENNDLNNGIITLENITDQ